MVHLNRLHKSFTQLLISSYNTCNTIGHSITISVCTYSNNKTHDGYIRIAQELLNLEKNLPLASIMVDFKQVLFGALTFVFKEVQVRGCSFHFQQCIWRKIQWTTEVRERYISNSDFALNIKRL